MMSGTSGRQYQTGVQRASGGAIELPLSWLPCDQAGLKKRLREIAETRVRYMKGVVPDFSRPGPPTDDAFIESFDGKFRAECLNQHWFMSRDDAVAKCGTWRRDYNEVRPHGDIGSKPPISLVNRSAAQGPPWPAGTG